MKKDIFKNYFIFLIIPIITLALYLPNVNSFFISDDFIYLFYAKIFGIWTNPWINVHPFATIIFGVEFFTFNLDPLGYHLINISLHIFNGYLIFLVIKELTNNEKATIFGSLIFITFPIFTEPIIWISAQIDLWLSSFILLSSFSYLRFYKQGKKIWLIFSFIYFTCALLCNEITIAFLPIYLLFDVFNNNISIKDFRENDEFIQKIVKISKKYTKYILFASIIIIYYLFFGLNKKINYNSSAYLKFAYFIDFIPNSFIPILLDNSELYMILFTTIFFSVIIIIYYVYFKSENKLFKFIFSWVLILIAGYSIFNLMGTEIYFYLLLFNVNSGPQGRFFYIIGVGVVIFYSVLLSSLFEKKVKLRFNFPLSRNLIIFSLILFILIGNSILLYSQHKYWNRSSKITTNILLKTLATVPIGTRGSKIYYINVPANIKTPYSPSYSTTFVFRNGLQEMVRIFYPDAEIFCFNMYWHKSILDFELSAWRIPIGTNEFNQFSNDSSNTIFFFNPVTELLINVSGLNYSDFDPYPYLGIPKLEYWFN